MSEGEKKGRLNQDGKNRHRWDIEYENKIVLIRKAGCDRSLCFTLRAKNKHVSSLWGVGGATLGCTHVSSRTGQQGGLLPLCCALRTRQPSQDTQHEKLQSVSMC